MLAAPDAPLPVTPAAHSVAHEPPIEMLHYLRKVMFPSLANKERFHTVFFDRSHDYIADHSMGTGADSWLCFRLGDLFGKALSLRASAIIIAHNHPSGICRPSPRDIRETRRLATVGREVGIELLDHLIITRHAAYSMRQGGHL
ncbi:MAG: JAB domain-containing protein [Pseudomonadota bacterium]